MTDEELISAYVDGRMSEPERVAFEARLLADAALRRQVAVTRLLVDQSRQVESVPTPKNFILPQDFGKAAQPATPARRFDWRLLFFRLGSVAAAMVFVFAVAFDALRSTPPATPVAAPKAAQATSAAEAAITTNVEPVTATSTPEQAPEAGAAMPASTPMMQSRAMQTDSMSTMYAVGTIAPADTSEAMTETLPSAKVIPMTQTQNDGTQSVGTPAAASQAEPLIMPLRVIAGVALLLALLFGVLGWRKRF